MDGWVTGKDRLMYAEHRLGLNNWFQFKIQTYIWTDTYTDRLLDTYIDRYIDNWIDR